MKAKKYLIMFAISILFSTINLLAQEKEEKKEQAEPDKMFDFQNLPFTLNEEEEKELLQQLNNEKLKSELKMIKDFNKQKYFNFLRESQRNNLKLKIPFFDKSDKLGLEREEKIFELEVATEALAVKILEANKNEKEKLKEELKKELTKLFEEKEKNRKHLIVIMEKKLDELKRSLKIREQKKEEIINKRMNELLKENNYLEW